eukprot:117565_1
MSFSQTANATKNCVFGYIRRESKSSKCVIPTVIYQICLAFYSILEYFEKSADDITISVDKMSITKTLTYAKHTGYYFARPDRSWRNFSYLSSWIQSNEPQIVKWTFKVNSERDDYKIDSDYIWESFCFGIMSDDSVTNCAFLTNGFTGYHHTNAGGLYHNKQKWSSHKNYIDSSYKSGETITIYLNLFDKILSIYKLSDNTIYDIFTDIKIDQSIKYKLAVCLKTIGDKVKLIDHATWYHNEYDV